jgi:WD40 repeat protein
LNRVLVAAGTAFGEIIYWSWSDEGLDEPASIIHRVFLGHEGSIFGVQISKELPTECCQRLRRVVASCSDDRTIRIWDVSDVNTNTQDSDLEVERTRHTGFSNEAFDSNELDSSNCLAIGWGHLSRVWTVRFLEASPCNGSLLLQSAGEDATARAWELTPNAGDDKGLSYKLLELDCAAHHSGKNMWSTTISHSPAGLQQVTCGGADSKITTAPLSRASQAVQNVGNTIAEYTISDILSWAQPISPISESNLSPNSQRNSKKAEFFRSYCFLDETTFLLTTNSGKVLVGSLSSDTDVGKSSLLSASTFIAQPEDLSGFSVCTSSSQPGVAFVAGATGSIYMYCKTAANLIKIHSTSGKVGDMFTADVSDRPDQCTTALLITLVGQSNAQLVYVNSARDPYVLRIVHVHIPESSTGSVITSMTHPRPSGDDCLVLGFRRGSIAVYRISDDNATLSRVIDKAHDDETVTSLTWVALFADLQSGYLLSTGRNGRLAVHYVDLAANVIDLVHNLALPFGPNIEGLYFQSEHLLVHGFSSKKWFLYDVTAEEEVMGIDTGGAHRSWTFRPHSAVGGTLVWTRASSMHVCSQKGPNHTVVHSGGHGREIKAVAVSPRSHSKAHSQMVATGAEDTDIKIFQYVDQDLVCQRTLRKHTTGIQHLQWSKKGDYLFSSGGCEECMYKTLAVRHSKHLCSLLIASQFTSGESEESSILGWRSASSASTCTLQKASTQI